MFYFFQYRSLPFKYDEKRHFIIIEIKTFKKNVTKKTSTKASNANIFQSVLSMILRLQMDSIKSSTESPG